MRRVKCLNLLSASTSKANRLLRAKKDVVSREGPIAIQVERRRRQERLALRFQALRPRRYAEPIRGSPRRSCPESQQTGARDMRPREGAPRDPQVVVERAVLRNSLVCSCAHHSIKQGKLCRKVRLCFYSCILSMIAEANAIALSGFFLRLSRMYCSVSS